ncbi:PilN domain-containing protein [Pseudomonas sp. Gutcm_11s]|uniref:PilN domain-containing protein n=1 Tax=Pseudomonas sp. Gutcm_11s TaxID=3026088 RepID=UPI002360B8DF|nr:PilN domain-containing protein [Pseudomonas sp. Gutcm_11s]MDD0845338.1 PilN domain-containing protein [Pseudomonas sp. Gutcm_11s]
MARINLLPWREQLREERKQRFIAAMGGVLLVAGGLVFLGGQYLNSAIEQQNARNNYVKREIAALDARIAEIKDLRERRAQLLERMKIIQDLQGNRPIIGHIFDQLVRTLPDGVFFTAIDRKGDLISIVGSAESNNRVSSLMRNLDASEWLKSPNLAEVKAITAGEVDQANVFKLTVKQTRPGVLEEESVSTGKAAGGKARQKKSGKKS